MRIINRKNYYEIGKNKPENEFSAAFQKASRRKKTDLINGAIEAFRAERPQNIRAILLRPGTSAETATHILQQITAGHDDKAADIDLAFKEADEGTKKEILTAVLHDVIDAEQRAEESFIAALLKSGADANAEYDGFAGTLLAKAVWCGQPQSIRDILFENGASAEGALRRAQARTAYSSGHIAILEAYQQKAAGEKQFATGAGLREIVLQVREETREEMQALREEVKRLAALVEASGANRPEEKKAATIRVLKS
jgi:hypothetical protein